MDDAVLNKISQIPADQGKILEKVSKQIRRTAGWTNQCLLFAKVLSSSSVILYEINQDKLLVISMGNTVTTKQADSSLAEPNVRDSIPKAKEDNSSKILLLHGWRTSGEIIFWQTAAFRYNVGIDVVKINAPWPAKGPPYPGIAQVYPNHPYFEWWETKRDSNNIPVEYIGVEKSLEFVEEYLEENGPFLGVLGFSQGATLTTLLAEKQEAAEKNWFSFVILIGGAPPLSRYSQNVSFL
jgi:pimeloyl-ACP methyl ester carboxylesterase